MWFKRSQKNRRLGRQFVLDVKLRSSQVRAKRVRLAAIALGGVFAAVASLYLAWQASQAALNLLIYENKAFAVLDIDAQTDGLIAADQLRRWTGVKPDQNLFALDLVGVRRNLELVSMIQSVSLEKVLPHTLRLRVTEREPLAQLSVVRPKPGGGLEMAAYYLDADAFVFLPLDPSQYAPGVPLCSSDQLPLIVGVNPTEVQPGRRLDSPPVRAALELIQAFQRSSMQSFAELKKIDVGTSDVLSVKTGQGSEVTFGLRDLEHQLLRWHRVFQTGLGMNKTIMTIDLAVSNSLPVTWADTDSVSQIPIKILKPVHNRKKHV